MVKMANWYKELKDKHERTIEYKIESIAFNIANQVYTRMKELKLTQKEFAKRLKVSKAYVSQILKGKTNMTIETIIKLSEVLDLKPEINLNPKIEKKELFKNKIQPTSALTSFRVSALLATETGALEGVDLGWGTKVHGNALNLVSMSRKEVREEEENELYGSYIECP